MNMFLLESGTNRFLLSWRKYTYVMYQMLILSPLYPTIRYNLSLSGGTLIISTLS